MAHVVSQGQVTGQRRHGQLPAEATSFVGRTGELAGIGALLGTARMVTVVGPAGVGKTRISLRAAALAAGRFPDGVWLADLTGIGDPELLACTVAAALGLPGADDAGCGADLLGYLRGKALLLVLDTCEHLIDACAAFADTVLRAAPGVTLLATSRQPLDAPGEHAFPLLPLPPADDAADLFAQRAAAVVPGFTVTPQNRADVVRLCQRLDGIPLAIELAAVRLRALPLSELAGQLESGIRLLTVSRRGTSPRHQTMRAAVEWSYRLCTADERALWERLSVFAAAFDLGGAEQVCADDDLPRERIVHALVGLVDKSVVLRDAADPHRYLLIAALREFGADKLTEPERFLGRLAARSASMARELDEVLRGSDRPRGSECADGGDAGQAAAFRDLDREYGNIRAVLGYALGPAQEPTAALSDAPAPAVLARWRLGADLAVRLSGYWQISGQLDEGRQWLGRAARLFPEPAWERARVLGARGRLATFQGDLASALADIRESIRLTAAAGRGYGVTAARGYLYLNLALTFDGQYAEALAAGETARQLVEARGCQSGQISLQAQLAYLHQLTGNLDEAIGCCDRGLALLAQSGPAAADGERWLSGYLHLLSGLALAQLPGGEHACAMALCRALTAKHELGDVVGTAYVVEALAWLAVRREQYERTAWLTGAADQLWSRLGCRLSGVARVEESRRRTLKAARDALGERRYATCYARGAALHLDAVVREAVGGGSGVRGTVVGGTVGGGTVGGAGEAAGQRAGAAESAAVPDAGGETPPAMLTRREREIAVLVASGLSNREIADRLFISKRTVDAHVEHIFSKLKISSRVQLTVLLQNQDPRTRAVRP